GMESMNHIKVKCAEDCGNAPKKQLLKELSIAFVNQEFGFCLDWVADDITCEIIGGEQIQGKEDFEQILHKIKDFTIQELHIHNIITHGNAASLNGTVVYDDQQRVAFCNVYRFWASVKMQK